MKWQRKYVKPWQTMLQYAQNCTCSDNYGILHIQFNAWWTVHNLFLLLKNIYVYLLCCSLPVPLSRAETWTIPLASMSNVTSIWGTPLGAGGIPTNVNCPRSLLSLAISRSPWCTLISTCVWPSAAVENTYTKIGTLFIIQFLRNTYMQNSIVCLL